MNDADLEKYFYSISLEKELSDCIRLCDRKAACLSAERLLKTLFSSPVNNIQECRTRITELVAVISRSSIEGGADQVSVFRINCAIFQRISNIETFESFSSCIEYAVDSFLELVSAGRAVKHANAINRARIYISNNYRNKLTLKEVADAVYLSPSYFCRIFREETGLNLNTYINLVRIEKGRRYLKDTVFPLTDISVMCGFEDQSYFTKVFKKMTGVTPGSYRSINAEAKIETIEV